MWGKPEGCGELSRGWGVRKGKGRDSLGEAVSLQDATGTRT